MKIKSTLLLIFAMLTLNCQAQQNELLVRKNLIEDWSKYPVYPRLVEDRAGEKVWKKEFAYLDSIEVYSITYLSDGLKINGLMARLIMFEGGDHGLSGHKKEVDWQVMQWFDRYLKK